MLDIFHSHSNLFFYVCIVRLRISYSYSYSYSYSHSVSPVIETGDGGESVCVSVAINGVIMTVQSDPRVIQNKNLLCLLIKEAIHYAV
jgi:hypothetical protein